MRLVPSLTRCESFPRSRRDENRSAVDVLVNEHRKRRSNAEIGKLAHRVSLFFLVLYITIYSGTTLHAETKGESAVVSKDDLKKKLTPLQFEVTQNEGTEPPFKNEYWDNHRPGIYVDVVSGEPLFSSLAKYESGTGWPSFFQPLVPENIALREDNRLFAKRTEVRSKNGNSHLGHVFDDGPAPTGKRYCMNSASMRFIPVENLEKEGYGQFVKLFVDADGQPKAGTKVEVATFAGGCFWCLESDFDHVKGVLKTTSGYTGGNRDNPTYEQVSSGGTGHAESLQVEFDPSLVSYEQLVEIFWRLVDPTVKDAQFCDHGPQYRSAIFAESEDQRKIAEHSKQALTDSKRFPTVYTEVTPAGKFYPAEDYHQKYYRKNPVRYKFYRFNCGRDKRLKEIWGKERDDFLGRYLKEK